MARIIGLALTSLIRGYAPVADSVLKQSEHFVRPNFACITRIPRPTNFKPLNSPRMMTIDPDMSWFYAPYIGNRPASTVVNGHRVVIVSKEPDRLAESLTMFGADRVKRLRGGDSEEETLTALQKFSKKARGSIVVAPPEAGMSEVMKNLESELPWVQ